MEFKKNQIIPLDIDAFSSEGAGIGRIGGFVVFVQAAVPGDRIMCRITKANKNFAYGRIEEMLAPSDRRQAPECPYFPKCGGCDFWHISYGFELETKKKMIEETVRRIGGVAVEAEEMIAADDISGYRNKAVFPIGTGDDGRIVTGFYRERSHDIVSQDVCIIQSGTANRAARAVCSVMNRYGMKPYDPVSMKGTLRYVFVRTGDLGASVCLVSGADGEDLNKDAFISEIKKACPEVKSIVLNINRTAGNRILSDKFETISGEKEIEDELLGSRFKISPPSFYQVNKKQAEKLYKKAAEYADIKGDSTVVDLYCGTGTIGLTVAKTAKKLIGVEIVPQAVEDAKENAARNGVRNAKFICADAGAAAKKLCDEGERPDIVIVDPPRKGLDDLGISAICEMGPDRIVYISCDVATLARDIKKIAETGGYQLEKLSGVDMFPRTRHVECVALMEREKNNEGENI